MFCECVKNERREEERKEEERKEMERRDDVWKRKEVGKEEKIIYMRERERERERERD